MENVNDHAYSYQALAHYMYASIVGIYTLPRIGTRQTALKYKKKSEN